MIDSVVELAAVFLILVGSGMLVLGLASMIWSAARWVRRGSISPRRHLGAVAPPPLSTPLAERKRQAFEGRMQQMRDDIAIEQQAREYLAKVWPDKADELVGPRRSER